MIFVTTPSAICVVRFRFIAFVVKAAIEVLRQ